MAGTSIAASGVSFGAGEALRVEDVMAVLHLSRNTVYKMARDGTLPSYRVGRQIRFRYEDVRARLEQSAASSEAGAALMGQGAAGGGAAHSGGRPGSAAMSGERPSAQSTGRAPSLGASQPDVAEPLPAWAAGSIIIGGQSMAGDVLANYVSGLGVKVLRSHDNAYLSLARMYLGTCHAAVVDLWSENDRSYNTPYLRRFLPGVPALSFRLFKQRVGFTVASGNPRGLRSWADILGQGVRVAARERGSGPCVLLDEKMKYLEARADMLLGADRPVASELAQALLVARGLADVAVTSEKPSQRIKGIDFVPLQDETVDLAVLNTLQTAPLLKCARSLLRTEAFRGEFDPVLYDTRLMGEVVYEC